MKISLAILLITLRVTILMAYHPTHMSIVNMELDSENMFLNYSIRLFQDDVNSLISSLYHEELYHTNKEFDFEENTQKFEQYFLSSININADSIKLLPSLVRKDINQEEYWLYYSIKLEAIPELLEIENTILSGYNKSQTNLFIFTYKGKEKGLTFDSNVTRHIINLNNI